LCEKSNAICDDRLDFKVMDVSKKRIRLKCRYDNEIRIVIISADYSFTQLYNRLTLDYGFDISLKYEDQDGDLITLTSQNDFEDLLMAESDVVNVIVSENMLPSLNNNKRQPQVTSLWSQGAGPSQGVSWAKQQQQQQQQHGSHSPFLHAPTPLSTVRQNSSNRLLERFPQIESSATPPLSSARGTRWKRGEILGQGAFGVVYLGLNVESGELMAVKQINNDELKTKELSSLENEINVLRGLKHPNIVRYIGTETNPNTLSIFLEYVPGGSLKSLIDKFGKLEEPVVRSYTRQLLLGLEYLHRNGIAHRDIKGGNCLVGNDGAVKLADFGASNSWRSPVESKAAAAAAAQESNSNDVKGTPSWMPPEVIRGEKPLNWKKADVWSLGCTVIEMTTGSPPWSQYTNPVTVLYHIACSDTVPEYPEDPSIELLTFLNSCLKRDPNERTDITSLLLHPFVASLQVQGAPGGGMSWGTGNWGQRPTTVSTTPAGEWEDTISQWKDFAPSATVDSSMLKSNLTPRTHQYGGGDSTARMLDCDSVTDPLENSSSRTPRSSNNLADLDMESTLNRHHVIDTGSIVRAHSRKLSSRKQSIKSQNLTDDLSPLTASDVKKDEDRQQISDLMSIDSLGVTSLENSMDELEDSTSTLGSGRVILESLDGMGSLVSHDVIGKGGITPPNHNFSDVKVSPINDSNPNEHSSLYTKKHGSISVTEDQQPAKEVIQRSGNKELRRTNSGISTTSSKGSKKSKSSGNNSNKQGSSSNKSADVVKDKRKNPPPNLVSPVKQVTGGASFTKNLEMKLVNNNEKVIEKVIKPLSRMASTGSGNDSPPPSRNRPTNNTIGPRSHLLSAPTVVPSSPIQVSNYKANRSKPFEYSNKPGESEMSTTGSLKKSGGDKAIKKSSTASGTISKKKSFEGVPDEERNSSNAFSGAQRSLQDEMKDAADEVHDEEMNFHVGEDDNSVADELSDDSEVLVNVGDNDEDDDGMMEFGSSMDNSLAGFDFGRQCYDQNNDNKNKNGEKANWTAGMCSKDVKYGRKSHSKQRLGQSQSTSSVPTAENTSDPNIGMYQLVGHSLKQGAIPSGSVQGSRIKTSIPSSKQNQRNTKGFGSSNSKQVSSRGGEVSAFRSLKIAGDSIDLRIGTGMSANTPAASSQKTGGGDRFFDNSLDGFDLAPPGDSDDHSEDSLTLPLHSVAEELDEHTSAITKLRMIPDKNIFISASLDSSLRIWGTEGSTSSRAVLDIPSFDARAKKAMPTTPKPLKFCGLWVDANCDFIWGGCSDGIVRVWNGGEGKPYRMMKGHDDLVTNLEGAPLEHMTSHSCASASLDKTVRVWDSRAKKAQCAMFRGHTDTIYSLKWLDGGRTIATASKDKTIKVWDVRTGRLQTTLDKHYGTVNLLKTLPDDFKAPSRKDVDHGGGNGSCFLSAARDGIMSLWSSDGSCLASQGAHRTAVTCMSDVQSHSDLKDLLHVSGPCVVTSGMDSIVRVWDVRRMKIASEFSLPNVVKVAWFNQSVITGSSSGEMYIWDFYNEVGERGETARGWSARELTHHTHQCSDIVTSKYCVASASKSGKILRFSAM